MYYAFIYKTLVNRIPITRKYPCNTSDRSHKTEIEHRKVLLEKKYYFYYIFLKPNEKKFSVLKSIFPSYC